MTEPDVEIAVGKVSASLVSAPALLPVCELRVRLGQALDLGGTRAGHRRITPILGGDLRGIADGPSLPGIAGLVAEILPGGADRQLVRPDETIEIDARYQARTATGGLIDLHATGIRRSGVEGVYFRVALRFETAEPGLAELQDAVYVADGVRERDEVRHTVYRLD